jgi:decaprenylphospho-beta-D-erythro-pentofuranosid-2-ulose 2-reductase
VNDALGSPQSILVLGGTSEIARAVVAALVARRCRRVVLAGRDELGLQRAASEATGAGATEVAMLPIDMMDPANGASAVSKGFADHGDLDVVLLATGVLGEDAAVDPRVAAEVITTNFTGPAAALLAASHCLRRQGHGTIVVLSSVAGERARKANFVYGSSKAGLDAFSQGLDDYIAGSGVRVMIVRPGFVKTRMTEGMRPAPFATTPEAVATDVVKGLETGKRVVWSPAALHPVMAVMRHLPRPLWRKLPA